MVACQLKFAGSIPAEGILWAMRNIHFPRRSSVIAVRDPPYMNRHRRTPPNLDFREHPSNHLLVDYDVFRMRHRPSVTYRPEVAANVVCANAIFKLHVGVVRDTSSRYGGDSSSRKPPMSHRFRGSFIFSLSSYNARNLGVFLGISFLSLSRNW